MCFDFLFNDFPEVFSIREEFNEVLWHTYFGIHVKFPILLSDLKEIWIFPTYCNGDVQYKISRVLFQWVSSCSMRTDGQTDDTNIRFTERRNRAQKLDGTTFNMSWTLLSMLGFVFPLWQVPYQEQSPEVRNSWIWRLRHCKLFLLLWLKMNSDSQFLEFKI